MLPKIANGEDNVRGREVERFIISKEDVEDLFYDGLRSPNEELIRLQVLYAF